MNLQDKPYNFFAFAVNDKEKSFITLTQDCNNGDKMIKLFSNKLERLWQINFTSYSRVLRGF